MSFDLTRRGHEDRERDQAMNDWHNIEVLSLHDPVLYAAVTLVRQGAFSREEALIAAVRALSEQVTMLIAAKTDALYFGDGFVHVAHASGEFRYRRLDPASVTIHGGTAVGQAQDILDPDPDLWGV